MDLTQPAKELMQKQAQLRSRFEAQDRLMTEGERRGRESQHAAAMLAKRAANASAEYREIEPNRGPELNACWLLARDLGVGREYVELLEEAVRQGRTLVDDLDDVIAAFAVERGLA
jgi:hypothetical protein